jgi:hypothetical protein
MVVSMVKLNWIPQLCLKCFYSRLCMTLECRDTNLQPVSECITMSLPRRAEPTKSVKDSNMSINGKTYRTEVEGSVIQ